MKVFSRELKFAGFLPRVMSVCSTAVQLFRICKNPVSILKAYMYRQPVASILLKNGYRIFLSTSRHDLATFVVIFCRREYGKLSGKKQVIDIGANIGIFSMYAICNGAEMVYSFEPNTESFETINKTIQANHLQHRWQAFQAGVNATGSGKMYLPKKSSPGNVTHYQRTNDENVEEVDTVSINDFVQANRIVNIDLMKVDCEGAEYEILPSLLPGVAAKIHEMRMEFHGSEKPLITWLEANNFTITKLEHNLYEPNLGYLWASNTLKN